RFGNSEEGTFEERWGLISLSNLLPVWKIRWRTQTGFYITEFSVFLGRQLMVVSGDNKKPEIWDLERGRMIFKSKIKSGHTWLYQSMKETFLLSITPNESNMMIVQSLVGSIKKGIITITSKFITDK